MRGASHSIVSACSPACSLEAVATIVELMEESGMPPLCAALAASCDVARPLGSILAEAVQVRPIQASVC